MFTLIKKIQLKQLIFFNFFVVKCLLIGLNTSYSSNNSDFLVQVN